MDPPLIIAFGLRTDWNMLLKKKEAHVLKRDLDFRHALVQAGDTITKLLKKKDKQVGRRAYTRRCERRRTCRCGMSLWHVTAHVATAI